MPEINKSLISKLTMLVSGNMVYLLTLQMQHPCVFYSITVKIPMAHLRHDKSLAEGPLFPEVFFSVFRSVEFSDVHQRQTNFTWIYRLDFIT